MLTKVKKKENVHYNSENIQTGYALNPFLGPTYSGYARPNRLLHQHNLKMPV
jgi:hypothetical protein